MSVLYNIDGGCMIVGRRDEESCIWFADLTDIPFSTVRKRLKKMTESGIVERMGSTKSSEWRIID